MRWEPQISVAFRGFSKTTVFGATVLTICMTSSLEGSIASELGIAPFTKISNRMLNLAAFLGRF